LDKTRCGLKLSPVEIRGLTTIFGPKSGVVDEVLSHSEGSDIVWEYLEVLNPKRNSNIFLNTKEIKVLDTKSKFLYEKDEFSNTVADTSLYKNGFYIELPKEIHLYSTILHTLFLATPMWIVGVK
jgi:hypothetical protein